MVRPLLVLAKLEKALFQKREILGYIRSKYCYINTSKFDFYNWGCLQFSLECYAKLCESTPFYSLIGIEVK